MKKSHVLLVGCTLQKDVRIAGRLLYWVLMAVVISCTKQCKLWSEAVGFIVLMCVPRLGAVCANNVPCANSHEVGRVFGQ